MATPTSSLATLRPDLGGSFMEWDIEMDGQGFIAPRVLPIFEAGKQSGTFGKIPVEQLLENRDTKRAPGSGYSRGDFDFQTTTYACEEHGAEEPVDDRESTAYMDYFSAEQVASYRAHSVVLRNAEQRAADLLFNTTTFTATSVTNEWDDATNATPIDDVEAAVQRVYDACGLWPNALIINRKVFRNLRLVNQIVDRLKYSGHQDPKPGNITEQDLAEVFDLEELIVAGSSKNSANEG